MKTVEKHLKQTELKDFREIAAVKCIIDFRIAYYTLIGKNTAKYLKAAL